MPTRDCTGWLNKILLSEETISPQQVNTFI